MLETLKRLVCEANLELVRRGLVLETWGNLSAIDRAKGLLVIKPSGVPYSRMRPRDMVVVRLADGRVVEGNLRPSSDTPTHLELYRAFTKIGSAVHTHSLFATAWAQARRPIPVLGTTHADAFHGPVPCTRPMRPAEIKTGYERNTGRVIVETFAKLDPVAMPAVLVAEHGPFAWGRTIDEAVMNAAVLETVARMASETLRISPKAGPIGRALLEKHYLRKHGPNATYGQK